MSKDIIFLEKDQYFGNFNIIFGFVKKKKKLKFMSSEIKFLIFFCAEIFNKITKNERKQDK